MGKLVLAIAAVALVGSAFAQEIIGIRKGFPLTEEPSPPPIARPVTDDIRQPRAYPEQPPVIPHNIEGYEVTMRANRCLTCHARQFNAQFQAPMISITHFMDRDGQMLASVSPRRYFCTACHVPQHEVMAPVGNGFEDIDVILDRLAREPAR
jgi:nitrate reductase (cytochrome), electron transfer subunit